MIFSFIIPGRLSGANEIKSANRSHWSAGAKLVKDEKELCGLLITKYLTLDVGFKTPVRIVFSWTEPNRKRDPDNIMAGQKVILDSLVIAGVIPNDTQEWIKEIQHHFMIPDKIKPQIKIDVESL